MTDQPGPQDPNQPTDQPTPDPYGAPPSEPAAGDYTAPPSVPGYGTPPPTAPYGGGPAPSNYGAPPPAPSYGGPPPQPQFGGPPQPAYGGPGTAQAHSGYVEIPGLGAVKVATVGQRLVARIIDGVGLWIVALIVMGIGGFGLFASASTVKVDQTTGQITSTGGSGVGVAAFFLAIFVLIIIEIAYEVVLIALRGQTIGKQIMGVKVVLQENGQVPGWGPSFLRWILPAVGSFLCGIGALVVYLSVLFDNSGRQQGWHDKVAHDLVISTKP
jgi:uncharacterized RDD family membrane protein YckC